MPRATGPIGYIEHRSPRKDENGKYIIHPQFVQKEMYDAEKMALDSQGRCMTNGAHIPTALVIRRYPPIDVRPHPLMSCIHIFYGYYSCHFRKRISC